MAAAYVDTHAHLQEREFANDVDGVIDRAAAAGVRTIVVPGVDVGTSESASWIADRHPGAFFAAGFHPHEASGFDSHGMNELRRLLRHPKAVAVGEIGLDFYRMHSPRFAQLEAFEAMLDLARDALLPVIVHCREAEEDVSRMLRSWSLRNRSSFDGRPLGVMHYFSGTAAQARAYVDLGFLLSVHTSVTHPKAHLLRQVVSKLPLESMVIETDSPYGAPQSVRGKRNEPAYVVEVAAKIAEVKGLPSEAVAAATSANAARLFRLPLASSTLIGAPA